MLLNFINVMLVFSIGILLVNIAAVILNRRWLWFVITTVIELLFVYLVLYIQLPPKNLTTLLNVNILLAGVAAIINFIGNAGLSAVDKVRALGQHERHVKVTDKQAHFLRRYLLVLLVPIVLWIVIPCLIQFSKQFFLILCLSFKFMVVLLD